MSSGLDEVDILRAHLIRTGGLTEAHVDTLVEDFRDSGSESFAEHLAGVGVVSDDAVGPLGAAIRGEGPIQGLIEEVKDSVVEWLEAEADKKKSAVPALPPFPAFEAEDTSLEDRLSSIVAAGQRRPSTSPSDPTSWLAPGVSFGRYTLGEALGEGSSSVTFRANHPTLEVDIAIKVYRPTERLATSEGHREFMEEGQLLARVDHPNIVRVLDVETHAALPYIVFEYAGTRSLEQEIDQRAGLHSGWVAEIGMALADALSTLWAKRILHRDVKPDNVLVRDDLRVKLVDFGLAAGANDRNPDLVVGSPAYMAPEQITEPHRIDHRADMYALGATLYHALSGQPPFVRTTPKETLKAQLYDTPAPIRATVPDVDAGLEAVILRMLEKQRDARFESWRDAVQALAATVATTGAEDSSRSSLSRIVSTLLSKT